jgi:hypothetical protein
MKENKEAEHINNKGKGNAGRNYARKITTNK